MIHRALDQTMGTTQADKGPRIRSIKGEREEVKKYSWSLRQWGLLKQGAAVRPLPEGKRRNCHRRCEVPPRPASLMPSLQPSQIQGGALDAAGTRGTGATPIHTRNGSTTSGSVNTEMIVILCPQVGQHRTSIMNTLRINYRRVSRGVPPQGLPESQGGGCLRDKKFLSCFTTPSLCLP